ncbi:MAG TPA: type II secretion system F family protein [Candidatus Brocadiia bacterium]|nr:type II secretion system F family protein [Candidatus Brocadiia bacterium]
MPVFQYEAMNGQGKAVRDEIEARNTDEAIAKIRAMNLFPTKVKEKAGKKAATGPGGKKKRGFTFGGVSQAQLTTFTRQLSTLQDAGLPIVRSLRVLYEQMKPGVLKNVLQDVADDVESGNSLSEAMGKYPKVFDKLYVNMIRAGEAGGVLDVILQRLAEFREKSARLKRRVKGAMIYPIAVLTIALLIVSGIMVFIIPKFSKMFQEMNVELPGMTQALMYAGELFKTRWYMIPVVPFAFFIAFKVIGMSSAGRYVLDWIKFKIPLFGNIVNKASISRFARTLGTLIASGVPILEALGIVRDTAGNAVLARAIQNIHDSIREGETIADPLKAAKVTDDMVCNMVSVGEETGELDKMLLKVADVFDEEVDVAVEGLVSLIEPMMIVMLGGIGGFIVISLFMPLIKLMGSLGGG